ncbi:MAG: lysophospholipid acyltransferase family protein [Oligoflexia bacterium]|nr:lysophospholipid acyltransferase family protein [Oligoflexia bacterium]
MFTAAQKRRLFRDLEKVDPHFAGRIVPFLEGLYKYYFRCEIEGWENVPDERAMFVGNHNGLLTFEVLMMFYAWWDRFHGSRRALGLAHAIALENPFFRWIIPKLGAIPASPELALEALKRDYSLLVYPGGEKEAFRPYKERKKVDFFQRKGFIRIALKAKVPIVPIASIGAHETYVIFDRGEQLAEKLGLKGSMRLHGVPITARGVFFAWCVATGMLTFFPLLLAPAAFFWTFVPMPAKMKFVILPPVDVCSMVDPKLSEEENLQKIYDHVIGTIQSTVTSEYAKRKFPILG